MQQSKKSGASAIGTKKDKNGIQTIGKWVGNSFVADETSSGTDGKSPKVEGPEVYKKILTFYVDMEGYITFPDGSRYKGDMVEGEPSGEGASRYPNGEIYEGAW